MHIAQPYPSVTTYKFSKFKSLLSFETNTSSLFKLSLRTLSFGIYRSRPALGDGNNKNYLYKWGRITRRHKFLLAQWELLQKIKGQRFLELCFLLDFLSRLVIGDTVIVYWLWVWIERVLFGVDLVNVSEWWWSINACHLSVTMMTDNRCV